MNWMGLAKGNTQTYAHTVYSSYAMLYFCKHFSMCAIWFCSCVLYKCISHLPSKLCCCCLLLKSLVKCIYFVMVASMHGKPSRMGQYTVYCLEGEKNVKWIEIDPPLLLYLFLSYFPLSIKVFYSRCALHIFARHIALMATFSINVWLRFKFDSVSCSCHNCCPMPRLPSLHISISSIDVRSISEKAYYMYM